MRQFLRKRRSLQSRTTGHCVHNIAMANSAASEALPTPPNSPNGDRVALSEKVGLGLGKAVVDGSHGTLHVLLTQVYTMTMGLSPVWVSNIVFIQRIWDAVIDPFFGQYSDNLRTPWGRRRPMILVAAIPLGLLFAALWWFPRDATPSTLIVYLLIASLLFYVAHSMYAMPLSGLIIEATDDYHQRTKIAAFTIAFGFAVQIGSQWVFPLTQLDVFKIAAPTSFVAADVPATPSGTSQVSALVSHSIGSGIDVDSTLNGLRWVSVGCAGAFILAGLAPVFLCRERMYKSVTSHQKQANFLVSLRAVRGNRSFMQLLIARGIFSFSVNVVALLGGYMYYYQVWGGRIGSGAFYLGFIGSCFHVAAILSSMFFFPRIERTLGKRRTMQFAASVLLLGCAAKYICYQPGWIWAPVLVTITNGIAIAGVSLIGTSMLGDITDEDELNSGMRREGFFSSLLSWVDKAGSAIGTLITGYLLVAFGFVTRPANTPRDINFPQSATTLMLIKWTYIILPFVGALCTIWLIRNYALSEERVNVNKQELARRRAAVNSTLAGDSARAS